MTTPSDGVPKSPLSPKVLSARPVVLTDARHPRRAITVRLYGAAMDTRLHVRATTFGRQPFTALPFSEWENVS